VTILNVTVGTSIEKTLDNFGAALESAINGNPVAPQFGVGFASMAQFGDVFTPKRWELIAALKATGPLSIYALAKHLDRHYRNVYKDVGILTEWLVIEKNSDGHIFVPWDEIDVRLPLKKDAA
jgi:predicted transcriptional regulator